MHCCSNLQIRANSNSRKKERKKKGPQGPENPWFLILHLEDAMACMFFCFFFFLPMAVFWCGCEWRKRIAAV